ncbi:hypothetical protein BC936DRAFT_143107 [Jimgerdemannia flammicorona]|uniref:Uncharacterized protein n=1 Tax=Jimgerdemannia flammicorona TaxID=994334 RepID=A0A433DED3_9FUNG|nr:hypothetical protein BC936DRAFT_143107 [Jimgerdemannia flammicorona]
MQAKRHFESEKRLYRENLKTRSPGRQNHRHSRYKVEKTGHSKKRNDGNDEHEEGTVKRVRIHGKEIIECGNIYTEEPRKTMRISQENWPMHGWNFPLICC